MCVKSGTTKKTKPNKMKTKSFTKATLLTIFVMSVITAVTLNSCQKEVLKPKAASTSSSSAAISDPMVSSTALFNQMGGMMFNPSKGKGLIPNLHAMDSSGCAVITIDTVSKPHTVQYNYGPGCIGSDGKLRAGIVTVSFDNQDIRVVNNVWAVTYQGYTFGSFANVNGAISFTNTGTNINGNLVLVEAGNYVYSSGSATDTINVGYNYEWIAGETSSPLADLQFKITGSCSGSSSTGQTASNTITSALTRNMKTPGCNFYVLGTTHSVSPGKTEDTDYGTPGGCSGLMAVTKNGMTSVVPQ
jgi:hypothetical protein